MHDLAPILVAEDSDDDFHFFRRAARVAGIENPLLRFRDGSELISFIEKCPVSTSSEANLSALLFVDLSMPVMNGFQVLEWLKARDDKRFMPVVLSGSRREEDITRAYGLGAEEYLVKPLSPVTLAALAVRPAGMALAS